MQKPHPDRAQAGPMRLELEAGFYAAAPPARNILTGERTLHKFAAELTQLLGGTWAEVRAVPKSRTA